MLLPVRLRLVALVAVALSAFLSAASPSHGPGDPRAGRRPQVRRGTIHRISNGPGRGFNCTDEHFQSCLQLLQSVTQDKEMAFASTAKELQAVCRTLQAGVRCVDDHSYHCFSSKKLRIHDSVVSGARQVIEDLCVAGTLQDKYLRHAPCYKNVSTGGGKCVAEYRELASLGDAATTTTGEEPAQEELELGLRKTCCVYTSFVRCNYEHVALDCGLEAARFLQRHMERISGSLIHQHCSVYTSGSGCQEESVAAAPSSVAACIPLLFLLLMALEST